MGVGGARPPHFTITTITYKVEVYAPAKRADTLLLYALYGSTPDIDLFPIRLKYVGNLTANTVLLFLFRKSKVKASFYKRAPPPTHQNVALCVYQLMELEVGGRGGKGLWDGSV